MPNGKQRSTLLDQDQILNLPNRFNERGHSRLTSKYLMNIALYGKNLKEHRSGDGGGGGGSGRYCFSGNSGSLVSHSSTTGPAVFIIYFNPRCLIICRQIQLHKC